MRRYVQMLTSTWDNKYLASLVRGISHRFADEDIGLHIFNAYDEVFEKDFYKHDKEVFKLPAPGNYIGMIVVFNSVDAANDIHALVARFRDSGRPVITIDQHSEGASFYGLDNYQSMYKIVDHLITAHSCQTLNYVGGPEHNEENILRYKAYEDCLKAHGIAIDERRVRHYRFVVEDGQEAYREFKEMGIHLPDAVVCANDNMAYGYCLEAQKDGYSAPWDFRITGFDNIDRGQQFLPSITSVNRNWEQLGYDSADGLLSMAEGGTFIEEHHTTGYVKINESCGCAHGERSLRNDYMEILNTQSLARVSTHRQDAARKILCSAPNLDKFKEALYESNQALGISGFAVCLNETFFDPDLNSEENRFTETVSAYMPGSNETIDTKVNLLPAAYALDNNTNYIFSCLHFTDYTFGYCVMPFNEDLILHGEHRALMESLSLALMNIKHHLALDVMNERLRTLYLQDTLTGLYNRFGYRDLGADFFDKYAGNVFVVYADLDNLKKINDMYGHSYGDTAIKALADALKKAFSDDDIKIRMGGDEFIVIGRYESVEKLEIQRDMISSYLADRSRESDFPLTICASIAYVYNDPDDLSDIEALVHAADQKMYEIKQTHHNRRATDKQDQ
ncbi:MAG TPA: hypothetical protein DIS78_07985 [Lachnospiraceae bacterium]|nr:hypothetical protein [Lachnospiraceae bacterium]